MARGLLDDKANLVRPQPPSGPGPAQGGATLPGMLALLQFRERALAAKVGGAIAGAAAAAGGKAEAEKAATRAFEEQLDTVVAIGWAYVERYCLDNFCQVRVGGVCVVAGPVYDEQAARVVGGHALPLSPSAVTPP